MDALTALEDAVTALRSVWAGEAGTAQAVVSLEASRLVPVTEALAVVARRVAGVQAQLAGQVASASRRELGPDGLAKQHGYRNAATLIASVTGTHMADAARLIEVGTATTPGTTLTGEVLPAPYPHVAEGIETGRLGTAQAAAIIRMLTKVAPRANPDLARRIEQALVAQAPGLTLEQLGKLIVRAEAHLDPDGVQPREEEVRAGRNLYVRERDGRLIFTGECDAETGAPIVTALEAIVSASYRASSSDNPAGEDDRSYPQRRLDALALLAQHFLDCDHTNTPTGGATVIVRMTLETLQTGIGTATIDGIDQPISAGTARRMAATGGIIPIVLGTDSEILDLGREARLFTKPQKHAITERDGGCVGCGAPPGMCKVHHLKWWARDRGRTDLDNGVLLCEACHHRIHDNEWDILIEGVGVHAKVWLIPPAHIDPDRTPRPGGRRRYDYHAA